MSDMKTFIKITEECVDKGICSENEARKMMESIADNLINSIEGRYKYSLRMQRWGYIKKELEDHKK